MKKFLLKMLEIYHGIPFKLQRWMTNDEAKSIEKNFSSLCDCVDKGGAYYVSYRIRPQRRIRRMNPLISVIIVE